MNAPQLWVAAAWVNEANGRLHAMRSDGLVFVWSGSQWLWPNEYGSVARFPNLPLPGCALPTPTNT